jgi:hypothetical protein
MTMTDVPAGPPTLPPAPPPTPWGPPSFDPAPVSASRRGRRWVAAVIVALLVVAVGGLAVFASRSPSEGTTLPAVEPYSLAASAENAAAARSVEFDLSIAYDGMGMAGDMTMSGAVDNETGLATFSTDLGGMLGEMGMADGSGTIEMIIDDANDVAYLNSQLFGEFVPSGGSWVSIDLDAFGALGESGGPLGESTGIDPTELAAMLLDSEAVTELGDETIDGVATKHYQVTVNLTDAFAAVPALDDPSIETADLPTTVVYDVWVTEDNQLWRISTDLDVAAVGMAMTLDLRPSDESVDVTIPTDAYDLTSLFD